MNRHEFLFRRRQLLARFRSEVAKHDQDRGFWGNTADACLADALRDYAYELGQLEDEWMESFRDLSTDRPMFRTSGAG